MTDPISTEELQRAASYEYDIDHDTAVSYARELLAARQRIAELGSKISGLEHAVAELTKLEKLDELRLAAIAELEAAVRKLGWCRNCIGTGTLLAAGPQIRTETCIACSGAGWHPAAQPFVGKDHAEN